MNPGTRRRPVAGPVHRAGRAGRVLAVLAAATASASPVVAAPCGEHLQPASRQTLQAGGVTLAWAPRPAPIPVNQPFVLDVAVCGAAVTGLRVDADMPAHRHGMNYRVEVRPRGEGRHEAAGLLFHMPGRWRLIFDVQLDGRVQRLTQDLEVR